MKHPSISFLLGCYSAFTHLTVTTASTSQQTPAYSTFIHSTSNGNLTLALSAANDTGDTYIHFSAPAAYQWVGMGTGSKMDGSVMLIVYKNDSASGVTLSTRLAYGHDEPKSSSDIDCKLVSGTSNSQATLSKKDSSSTSSDMSFFSINVHCTNLPSLGHSSGKISLTNPRQHFLYALGPKSSSSKSLSSTSTSASIKEHSDYGTFWMDMTKATSASSASSNSDGGAAVPSGDALLVTTNAEGSDGTAESGGGSGETLRAVHAAFMLFAFVIILPLGAVLLRYLSSGVKVHGSLQTIGVVFTVVGGGLGIALSKMDNDNASFSHSHQIIGLVLFAIVFVQWTLGLWHHLRYRAHSRPTVYGKMHRVLGPAILILGLVNGFLGFDLSGENHDNVWYGVVAAVVFVAVVGLLGWKAWKGRKNGEKDDSNGVGMMALGDAEAKK